MRGNFITYIYIHSYMCAWKRVRGKERHIISSDVDNRT